MSLEYEIEQGRNATLVESVVKPHVAEQIDLKVGYMINSYRSGDLDGDEAVCLVAEMSALRGMMEELESRQRRGYLAAEKEYGDGEKAEDSSVSYK